MKRILDIMKSTYILLLVMVLLLAARGRQTQGANASQTSTWQEQYDLGIRYLSDNNYEEAMMLTESNGDIPNTATTRMAIW